MGYGPSIIYLYGYTVVDDNWCSMISTTVYGDYSMFTDLCSIIGSTHTHTHTHTHTYTHTLGYCSYCVLTNILLFHFRLNLYYWWILGRSVRHKAWLCWCEISRLFLSRFCFNHSFLFIFRLSSSVRIMLRNFVFSFIFSNYNGN